MKMSKDDQDQQHAAINRCYSRLRSLEESKEKSVVNMVGCANRLTDIEENLNAEKFTLKTLEDDLYSGQNTTDYSDDDSE